MSGPVIESGRFIINLDEYMLRRSVPTAIGLYATEHQNSSLPSSNSLARPSRTCTTLRFHQLLYLNAVRFHHDVGMQHGSSTYRRQQTRNSAQCHCRRFARLFVLRSLPSPAIFMPRLGPVELSGALLGRNFATGRDAAALVSLGAIHCSFNMHSLTKSFDAQTLVMSANSKASYLVSLIRSPLGWMSTLYHSITRTSFTQGATSPLKVLSHDPVQRRGWTQTQIGYLLS